MEKRKRILRTPAAEQPAAELNLPDKPVRKITLPSGMAHYIIVALLVISAFFVGSLSAKVEYLQKQGSAVPTNAVADNKPAPQADPTVGEFPKISNRDHVQGDANARLALIEYSDYECPFCKQFHITMKQVMQEYAGKVKFVYRHYPLDFHANAQKEAEGAECAYELGGNDAFWKYTDAVYERTTSNGTGFALDKLAPLAVEIGLSDTKFKDCLDSGRYTTYVKDDRDGGQKAGIQGTPGTIILDTKSGKTKLIPGALPFASVKTMLDEMLK
jgi:protein-disulfide isomerase